MLELGQTVITASAAATLDAGDVLNGILRHAQCDWGEVCEQDRQANDYALANEGRILSAYTTQDGIKFWIITEWNRSITTILLPEDY